MFTAWVSSARGRGGACLREVASPHRWKSAWPRASAHYRRSTRGRRRRRERWRGPGEIAAWLSVRGTRPAPVTVALETGACLSRNSRRGYGCRAAIWTEATTTMKRESRPSRHERRRGSPVRPVGFDQGVQHSEDHVDAARLGRAPREADQVAASRHRESRCTMRGRRKDVLRRRLSCIPHHTTVSGRES